MKSSSYYNERALASLAGITAVLGVCVYLTVTDARYALTFVFAAVFCYPWGRYLWNYANFQMRNPVRILRKSLPKCGFQLKKTELDSDSSTVRMFGQYNGGDYVIEASPAQEYVKIEELPWMKFKTCDPIVPYVLEAMNNTNACRPNVSVVLNDPHNGERSMSTITRAILPIFRATRFLDGLLRDIFNCKSTLMNSIKVECPWNDESAEAATNDVLSKDYCLN